MLLIKILKLKHTFYKVPSNKNTMERSKLLKASPYILSIFFIIILALLFTNYYASHAQTFSDPAKAPTDEKIQMLRTLEKFSANALPIVTGIFGLIIFYLFYLVGKVLNKTYIKVLSIISIIGTILILALGFLLGSISVGLLIINPLDFVYMFLLIIYLVCQIPLYLVMLFGVGKEIKEAKISAIIFLISIPLLFVIIGILGFILSFVYLLIAFRKSSSFINN